MYNYLRGGEQYKYATRPIVVTIPEDDPNYNDHCTDYHYISQTKIDFSKKMFELFGIHIDWVTYKTRAKGQECWYRGEVMFWKAGEDVSSRPFRTLCLFRSFKDYLHKKATITLEPDDVSGYRLLYNGDL